jgi:hypothetical protein
MRQNQVFVAGYRLTRCLSHLRRGVSSRVSRPQSPILRVFHPTEMDDNHHAPGYRAQFRADLAVFTGGD